MARFKIDARARVRYLVLEKSGVMPRALLLPGMSNTERARFVCSMAARGMLPELTGIAEEAEPSAAASAVALEDEAPWLATAFRREAEFWISFRAHYPSPRRRWRNRPSVERRQPASTPSAQTRAKAIEPTELAASSRFQVVTPEKERKGIDHEPCPDRGRASPRGEQNATESPIDPSRTARNHGLPPWAEDILVTLPPVLSRERAGEALGVSTKTIDRRIAEGAIPVIPEGTRILIARLEFVRYLVRRSHR
jgi:hypothetical protein